MPHVPVSGEGALRKDSVSARHVYPGNRQSLSRMFTGVYDSARSERRSNVTSCLQASFCKESYRRSQREEKVGGLRGDGK